MKDPAGDPSDRKNYRPITLLTEYGKIFERFIRRRFFATTVDFHSRRQYGFISGRSAVSALLKYKETIEETTDKYAATRYLLATLKSYLTDRTVTYRDGSVEVSKACTKGCPQGSVLGPAPWNSVLDMYLDSELLPNTEIIAYADDIAIVVRATTRQELRDHIRESVERLTEWALRQKLTISGTKKKIMINKSPPRVHHRDIRVKLGDSKIGIVSEMKYLGVIVDKKLDFHSHVRAVCERARKIVLALRRKVHVTWNVPVGRSLHAIYKCGILPIVAYASEVWAHRLRVSRIRRMLLSLGGAVGRMICEGYNSVSSEAAGVISGIPPPGPDHGGDKLRKNASKNGDGGLPRHDGPQGGIRKLKTPERISTHYDAGGRADATALEEPRSPTRFFQMFLRLLERSSRDSAPRSSPVMDRSSHTCNE
jgi:hypothetical protein